METVLLEWGNLLGRWLHVVAAMAWVGTSFYFMHIDAALRPSEDMPAGKGGEAWEVHGGGFYRVRKYLVAPPGLPDHLIWHKWASYSTWLSGVALLVWIYYLSADLFLIDPGKLPLSLAAAIGFGVGGILAGWVVYDLLCRSLLGRNDWALFAVLFIYVVAVAWLFQQVFTGRGALVHTGAVLATIMSGNVAMLIIPNQRKVVKALLAGDDPDPALGSSSKQRSTHNNYLTLPVVFLMLSNHYPLITDSAYAYLMVGLVLIAGAFIRHFFNERNAGRGEPWWCFAAAAVAMAGIVALSVLGSPAAREQIEPRAAAAAGVRRRRGAAAGGRGDRPVTLLDVPRGDAGVAGYRHRPQGSEARHPGGNRSLEARDRPAVLAHPRDAARQSLRDHRGRACGAGRMDARLAAQCSPSAFLEAAQQRSGTWWPGKQWLPTGFWVAARALDQPPYDTRRCPGHRFAGKAVG